MDENMKIGAKGTGNDLKRRSINIMKKQQEMLEELDFDLKKAEKEAKKNQIRNMVTLVPLVMTLKTMQILINNASKKPSKEELEGKKSTLRDKINDLDEFGNSIELITGEVINQKYSIEKNVIVNPEELFIVDQKGKEIIIKPIEKIAKKDEDIITLNNNGNKIDIVINKKDYTPIKETIEQTTDSEKLESLKENFSEPEFDKKIEKKLEKLKSIRIIDEYEKELKDVRLELRKTIFDYNVIVEETAEVYDSKAVQDLIDKLNFIIKKVEELKKSLNIDDYDKYDNNYLYVLIEDYLTEFKNNNPIKEIKESPLYIEISNKIKELDDKKDVLSKKLEEKKEKFEIDEDRFNELKDEYYNFDKLNDSITKFQKEQESIIAEMNKKIDNSIEVIDRVQTEVHIFNRLSENLLRSIRRSMLFPGVRSARAIMANAALTMHLMRQIINPQITTRKYKEIKVADYSKDIEINISSIDKNQNLLKKNFKELERIIKDFSKKYEQYFGKIKECDKLLSDLEKVKDSLKEKEYELDKIKDLQVKALERNNAKVKKIGEYAM